MTESKYAPGGIASAPRPITANGLRDLLQRLEATMRSDGCTERQIERALNVLLYGHAEGAEAIVRFGNVSPDCSCGAPLGDDEDDVEARRTWQHSRSCPQGG